MSPKLVLILLLSGLAVVAVAQNTQAVEVAFLFWRTSISSALLIFFTLLAGFLLGWFLHGFLSHRRPAK